MILTMFYENESQRNLDRGTITLRCIHNGERFAGKVATYDDPTDTIKSTETIWFRSKEKHAKFLEQIRERDKAMEQLRKREIKIAKDTKELSEGSTSADGEELENNRPENHEHTMANHSE